MTETEKLQLAKGWLEKMANGWNPVSDVKVAEDDCINQVEVSRCLFFVCGILDRVIAAGGNEPVQRITRARKEAFSITPEELNRFAFSETPITVTELARRINLLIDTERMAHLKYSSLTAFLLHSGYLEETRRTDGGIMKTPTEEGRQAGISIEERTGRQGAYQVTVYNLAAQQFILDNLGAVIEINNKKA